MRGQAYVRLSVALDKGNGSIRKAISYAEKQPWADTPQVLGVLQAAWDDGITKIRSTRQFLEFVENYAKDLLTEAVDEAVTFIPPEAHH